MSVVLVSEGQLRCLASMAPVCAYAVGVTICYYNIQHYNSSCGDLCLWQCYKNNYIISTYQKIQEACLMTNGRYIFLTVMLVHRSFL